MPLTIDEFCERLAGSKLLSADDARTVLSSMAENERPTDGESLARLLVKTGKLTGFQAKRICDGKGGSLLLGNYVLLDRIGHGGMGDVFKAEHRRMKRVVALKVVKSELLDAPGSLKRFQREVETVAKLDHPNVVTAHDADEANGIHFLVMQFVDGRDLSSVVKSQGPFSVPQAVDCVLQAARGLAYAHEQGIVHRDVKPGNMLLDRKGMVKILDLGLATLTARDANANDSLTGSEMIVGTLDYMAPEQAQSPKLADERSDIYSLGMTLWFLLTGRAAFEAETVVAKLLAHQQQPIPSLLQARPDAPGQLDDLFQRMAAKQPADRPRSMQQVVAALEALLRGQDIAPALARAGNTEMTGGWARSDSGGTVRQASGPTSVANALHAHAVSIDQTASMVKPQEDTTANTKRPDIPIIVSTAKRRARRVSWRQYSLIGISAALFIIAAIGSPLLMLKLSTPTGSIVVTTDQPEVEGANVSLDGQTKFQVGKSGPQRAIRLAADDQHHTLFVSKDGFQPYSRQIRISDSAPQRVFVHLSPIAKPAAAPNRSVPAAKQPIAGEADNPKSKIQNLKSEPGGFALEFNGKDSHVDLPTLRYDGSHPITLEATIVPYQLDEDAAVIADAESRGSALEVGDGGHFIATDAVRYHGVTATRQRLELRRRVHLAALIDGISIRLYIDGKLQQSNEFSGPYKPSHQFFRIGTLPPILGEIRRPFTGVIDEIRISKVARYDKDFTPPTRFEPDKETLALYHFDEGQGEVLSDSSGNGHQGKIVNAKWVPGIAGEPPAAPPTQRPSADYALEFNGKDSHVDLPTLRYDGSHPITLEASVVVHQVKEGGHIFGGGTLAGGIGLTFPAPGDSRNQSHGIFSHRRPRGPFLLATRERLVPDRWMRVAAVLDENNAWLFLDGQLQQRGDFEREGKFVPSDQFLMIGGSQWRPSWFDGLIDEVRISKIARYKSDYISVDRFEPDKDTLALYHFDEGQGEVLTDSSGNSHHGRIVNAKWVPGIAGGPPISSDKRAAEAVLALGGTPAIRQAGQEQVIEPGGALPQDDFELVRVQIFHQPQLTDVELRNVLSGARNVVDLQLTDVPLTDACLEFVAPLPKLEILLLNGTQITGAGLKHLRGHQQLKKLGMEGPSVDDRALEGAAEIPNVDLLWLGGTQITDAGLAHLEPMKQLQYLNFGLTQITDVGVAQLRGLTEMRRLVLSSCRVTDASVASMQEMKKLEELELFNTAVTDAGLAILAAKGPKSIVKLDLEGTAITDAGLVHLKSLPRLRMLALSRTQVSDEGLEQLKGLKQLSELKLNRTKITAAGVEELKKALPGCQVVWTPIGKGKGKKALPAQPSAAK